jgi:hypothetical protein
MKGQLLENDSAKGNKRKSNNYLTIQRENKRYRINIKDIKKLYKLGRKFVSPPPF